MFKKLLGLIALLAFIIPMDAHATTCSASAVCKSVFYSFTNSTGTTPQALYTASGNGAKISAIFCSSTQPSSAPSIFMSTLHSGTTYPMWSVGFTATSGQNNGAVANLLTATSFSGGGNTNPFNALPTDEFGNAYILLASGDSLQIAMSPAVTSPYTITCYAFVTQY